MRDLEIKAVLDGGGAQHRRDLSTAILLKENHLAIAGGLTEAVQKARQAQRLHIEVETENLEQVKLAIAAKADRIMFDNFTNDEIAKAVALVPTFIETEASGNMALERVRSVAELGVNFISVGRITHSAPAADLSLIFDWNDK